MNAFHQFEHAGPLRAICRTRLFDSGFFGIASAELPYGTARRAQMVAKQIFIQKRSSRPSRSRGASPRGSAAWAICAPSRSATTDFTADLETLAVWVVQRRQRQQFLAADRDPTSRQWIAARSSPQVLRSFSVGARQKLIWGPRWTNSVSLVSPGGDRPSLFVKDKLEIARHSPWPGGRSPSISGLANRLLELRKLQAHPTEP